MIKRGNKSGQFYLISAIIVATIVMSIVVISNYSKKQEYSDLKSLKEEIQIESARVIDYSLNNGESDSEINTRLQDFTQQYIDLESGNKDLYFIFGTSDNIILKGYQRNSHEVLLDSTIITATEGAFMGNIDPGNNLILQIDEDTYTFQIKNWQNFYFVLSRDIEGGNYVVTG